MSRLSCWVSQRCLADDMATVLVATFVVHGCFGHMFFNVLKKGGMKLQQKTAALNWSHGEVFPKFKRNYHESEVEQLKDLFGAPLDAVHVKICTCFRSHVSPWPSSRYFHLVSAELFPQAKVPVDYLNSVWDRFVQKNLLSLNQVMTVGMTGTKWPKGLSGWWFQIFFLFTPILGFIIQFDLRIFFKWVGWNSTTSPSCVCLFLLDWWFGTCFRLLCYSHGASSRRWKL